VDLNLDINDQLPTNGLAVYVDGDQIKISLSSTVNAAVLNILRTDICDMIAEAIDGLEKR
jgi:hypothetical protein